MAARLSMVHGLETTRHHQVSLECDASALRKQLRLRSQERPGLVIVRLRKLSVLKHSADTSPRLGSCASGRTGAEAW